MYFVMVNGMEMEATIGWAHGLKFWMGRGEIMG